MSGPVRETPALAPFSFESDEMFQPLINPADVEIGLEVAGLEERHYIAAGSEDKTTELADAVGELRKYAEARAELEGGLQDGLPGAREFAMVRFATRMLRAGFVAGQRHEARENGGTK